MSKLLKSAAAVCIVACAGLVGSPAMARGFGHGRVGVGVGVGLGVGVGVGVGLGYYGYYGWPYYSPYYAYPPAAYPPGVYAPDGYVAGAYPQAPAPAVAAAQPVQSANWYFCPDSQAYYPHVRSCASAWQPVPAQPPGVTR